MAALRQRRHDKEFLFGVGEVGTIDRRRCLRCTDKYISSFTRAVFALRTINFTTNHLSSTPLPVYTRCTQKSFTDTYHIDHDKF
jgi:hypothetical protein